jgi:hypothetical protein
MESSIGELGGNLLSLGAELVMVDFDGGAAGLETDDAATGDGRWEGVVELSGPTDGGLIVRPGRSTCSVVKRMPTGNAERTATTLFLGLFVENAVFHSRSIKPLDIRSVEVVVICKRASRNFS